MLGICKNKIDSVELIHDSKQRPLFVSPSVYEIHKDILEVTNDVCSISIYFLQKKPLKNASNTGDSLLTSEKLRVSNQMVLSSLRSKVKSENIIYHNGLLFHDT